MIGNSMLTARCCALYPAGMTEEKRAALAEASVAMMDAVDAVSAARAALDRAVEQRDVAIRSALAAGMSQEDAAEVTGMRQSRISQIKRGVRV